jgi:4-carboxymuconolactone decarboxylase
VIAVAISLIALVASLTSKASAQKVHETAATRASNAHPAAPTPDDLRVVSPALERYRQGPLMGDLWKRPGLSQRDRCVVTLAALIARNQTAERKSQCLTVS